MGSLEQVVDAFGQVNIQDGILKQPDEGSDGREADNDNIKEPQAPGLADVFAACPSHFAFEFGFEIDDFSSLTCVSKAVRNSLKGVSIALLCPSNSVSVNGVQKEMPLPKALEILKNTIIDVEFRRFVFSDGSCFMPKWFIADQTRKNLKALAVNLYGSGSSTYAKLKTPLAYYEGSDAERFTIGFNETGKLVFAQLSTNYQESMQFVETDDGGRYEFMVTKGPMHGLHFYAKVSAEFTEDDPLPDKLTWVCKDQTFDVWNKVDGLSLYTPIHELSFLFPSLHRLVIGLYWREPDIVFSNCPSHVYHRAHYSNYYPRLRLTKFPSKLKEFWFCDAAIPHVVEIVLPGGLKWFKVNREHSKGKKVFLLNDFPETLSTFEMKYLYLFAKGQQLTDLIFDAEESEKIVFWASFKFLLNQRFFCEKASISLPTDITTASHDQLLRLLTLKHVVEASKELLMIEGKPTVHDMQDAFKKAVESVSLFDVDYIFGEDNEALQ